MVRANRRKAIEEVYGTKMEALQPVRVHPPVHPGMTKTAAMRASSSRQGDQARTQRSYVTTNDYYITTNVPLNATNMRPAASAVMAHPSKTSQMPAQAQAASPQMLNYGSTSNRRCKPSVRQTPPGQPAKVHFLATDGKAHYHPRPHVHTHPYAKPMPMPMPTPLQMTQRTVYAPNSDMDAGEISDKDQMRNTRRSHMHSHQNQKLNQQHSHPHPHMHPLQHQLHQQQQLSHPNNSIGKNNMHQMHEHSKMKHQLQQQQQHGAGHSHQRAIQVPHVTTEDDDKDEDPEEFFELIRQTVKTVVGTTISELVTRNFRELASKMEHFTKELKTTNDNMGKLQSEVTNKVMHYGEENTRHFRYLCMKSEYDKMLYQQQTTAEGKQLSSKAAPMPLANPQSPMPAVLPNRVAKLAADLNMKCVKQEAGRKINHVKQKKIANKGSVKVQNTCACHSTSNSSHQPVEEQQSLSEGSVNVRSSELGVREMLGQIQRFCTQMQLGDIKEEPPKYNSQTGLSTMELGQKPSCAPSNVTINSSRKNSNTKAGVVQGDDEDMDMETPVDSMDEIEIDNFQYSSDEMSSYSDDDCEVKFTGNTTARVPLQSSRLKLQIQHSNKGAGDGQ